MRTYRIVNPAKRKSALQERPKQHTRPQQSPRSIHDQLSVSFRALEAMLYCCCIQLAIVGLLLLPHSCGIGVHKEQHEDLQHQQTARVVHSLLGSLCIPPECWKTGLPNNVYQGAISCDIWWWWLCFKAIVHRLSCCCASVKKAQGMSGLAKTAGEACQVHMHTSMYCKLPLSSPDCASVNKMLTINTNILLTNRQGCVVMSARAHGFVFKRCICSTLCMEF